MKINAIGEDIFINGYRIAKILKSAPSDIVTDFIRELNELHHSYSDGYEDGRSYERDKNPAA